MTKKILFFLFLILLSSFVSAETHTLREGWNLFSYPYDGGISFNELDSLCSPVDSVWGFDARYIGISGEDIMQPGRGYWVHTTDDCSFDLEKEDATFTHSLKRGWNLVGVFSTTTNISDIIGNCIIPFDMDILERGRDFGNAYYSIADKDALKPFNGYWVYVARDCTFGELINKKDMSKYSEKEVFLVSDKKWRTVASLKSVARWKDNEGVMHNYPVLEYYDWRPDINEVKNFLNQNSPTHITIVAESASQDLIDTIIASGYTELDITHININDYYSYWSWFNDVLYVESYKSLVASVVDEAVQQNIPLIVKNSNMDSPNVFEGKNVILAGDVLCPANAKSCDDITTFYPGLNIQNIKDLDPEELRQYVQNNEAFVMVHPSWAMIFSADRLTAISEISDPSKLHQLEYQKRLTRGDVYYDKPGTITNRLVAFEMDAEKGALLVLKNSSRLLIFVLPNYWDCRDSNLCDDAYFEGFVSYLNQFTNPNVLFVQSEGYGNGYAWPKDIAKLVSLFQTLSINTLFFMGGYVDACESNFISDLNGREEFNMIQNMHILPELSVSRESSFFPSSYSSSVIRNAYSHWMDETSIPYGESVFCTDNQLYLTPSLFEHIKSKAGFNFQTSKNIGPTNLLDLRVENTKLSLNSYFGHFSCTDPNLLETWETDQNFIFTCIEEGMEVKDIQTCCSGLTRVDDYSSNSLETIECTTTTSSKQYCVRTGDGICDPDIFSGPENTCVSPDCIDYNNLPDFAFNGDIVFSQSTDWYPKKCITFKYVNQGTANIIDYSYYSYYKDFPQTYGRSNIISASPTSPIFPGEGGEKTLCYYPESTPNEFVIRLDDGGLNRIIESDEDNNCIQGTWDEPGSFIPCKDCILEGQEVGETQFCCKGLAQVEDYSALSLDDVDCNNPTSNKNYCVKIGDRECGSDWFSGPENMCVSEIDCVNKSTLPDLEIIEVVSFYDEKRYESDTGYYVYDCVDVKYVNKGETSITESTIDSVGYYDDFSISIFEPFEEQELINFEEDNEISPGEQKIASICQRRGEFDKEDNEFEYDGNYKDIVDKYVKIKIDTALPGNMYDNGIFEANEDNNCIGGTWGDVNSFAPCQEDV